MTVEPEPPTGAARAGETRPADYYWFTPKRHGYGANPKTWQGWVATLAFAIGLPLVSVPILLLIPAEMKTAGFMLWAIAVIAATWRFLKFVRARTDGEWLWRYKGTPYRYLLGVKDNG